MSQTESDPLAEATRATDYRALRKLALGCTAWVTLQLGFVALLAGALIRPGSGSARNVAGIWVFTDAVILFLLVVFWAFKNLAKELS